MTFSLCARDAETGQVGVGILTAMMGVGKLSSYARAGTGAAATQATINPYLGIDALALIAEGRSASEALEAVIARDDGRDLRQVGVVDLRGDTAAWTGDLLEGWAGHLAGQGVVAQGNRLVGIETLEATLEAYQEHQQQDLAERLLAAIEAGEATGADTQGATSGAIYIMDREEYPLWDIRVDSADDPAAALRYLAGQYREEIIPQIRKMSTRDDYMGEMTREQLREVGRR